MKKLLWSLALFMVPLSALAEDPKLLQGLKNANTAATLTGAAAYNWVLVIALIMLAGTVLYWVYSNKNPQANKEGVNKMLIIGFVGSVVLFSISGFLFMGAEFTGATTVDSTIKPLDYRSMGDTTTSGSDSGSDPG